MELDQSFEISPLEESRHLHHVCDHCSYSTADKSNFNKHIRRHTAKIVAVTDTATLFVFYFMLVCLFLLYYAKRIG